MYEFLSNIARENVHSGVFALMYHLKDMEHTTTKLYHCNAKMKDYNGYIILQSYSTDVAIYIHWYNIIVVYDIYSNTTAQHIHKFAKYLECYNFLWTNLKSDNTFIEYGNGLIYGTYQKKHERIYFSKYPYYEKENTEIRIIFNLINWLIGQHWID